MCVVCSSTSCVSSTMRDQGLTESGGAPAADNESEGSENGLETEPGSRGEPEPESETGADSASESEAEGESESQSGDSEQDETEEAAGPWKPPDPGSDEFDWIRLKSGEWLKGEILFFRNRTLRFDSDELDELDLDWKDVVEVRSPRMNMLMFEGRVRMTGTVLIRDDVVHVGEAGESRTYPRNQLVSLVPGEEKETDYWSGKVTVGTTFRSGNTDQTEFTARSTFWRRTGLTRTTLDYTGAITTIDDREEVNNHRAYAEFNVYLTSKLYATPAAFEYYRDRISNIRHRMTPSAGGGYWILDSPDLEWNADLRGGYRLTEYESVEAGEDRTKQTAAVIAATMFDWEVTSDVDLILEYRIDVGLDDLTGTNHHAVTTLSIDLTKVLDLDVSFIWDRVGKPQRDDDGDVPEKDDFRLVLGFGVDF